MVFVLVIMWLFERRTRLAIPTDASRGGADPTLNRVSQDEASSPSRRNGREATGTASPAKSALLQPPPRPKSKQLHDLVPLVNVPILLYGKLEDQFGNPIQGAEITGDVTVFNGYAGTHEKVLTTSDARGLFTLDGGRGQILGVLPQKAGYALASLNAGGDYSKEEAKRHADPDNPVAIKMWKLQGEEPLLRINQNYTLHYTNEPIHFDLIEGRKVSSGGDITITVHRAQGIVSERHEQEWSLEIEAVSGGLVGSSGTERTTYAAPESGYRSGETFVLSTNPPYKWSGGLSEGFFVKSREGQVYSKLRLVFRINENPEDFMSISFSGVANTNGSRNWEGDPNTFKPR